MEEDAKLQIEEIIGQMKCPKDFICYKSGFESLCRTEDTGTESFIKCMGEDHQRCTFSIPFGYGYMCHCRLRVYICKKLKR